MSIEEIDVNLQEIDVNLQEIDVSEGIVLGLGQTNLNESVEDIEDIEEINEDDECDDESIYENKYIHHSLDEIQAKIQKRIHKIDKINKKGILRKLSPHHLIKEQSKKLEDIMQNGGDTDFIIDHLEILIFYLDQLDDVTESFRNIYMTLVELNEAKQEHRKNV